MCIPGDPSKLSPSGVSQVFLTSRLLSKLDPGLVHSWRWAAQCPRLAIGYQDGDALGSRGCKQGGVCWPPGLGWGSRSGQSPAQ